jgi:HSP20 family protein
MQVIRVNSCRPAHRVYKTASPRNMSLFAFPRFVPEISGAFRLLDELASISRHAAYDQAPRTFSPRFSVRENASEYELKGELPGVAQKDLSIEFANNQLRIRGSTESHRKEGTRPEAVAAPEEPKAVEAQPEQETAASETSSYHKASVEDEEPVMVDAPEAADTPAETPAESFTEAQTVTETPKQEPTYYFSERSFGEFARTFNFPAGSVDAENIKASLKDGILSILVPKAPQPGSKQITVE